MMRFGICVGHSRLGDLTGAVATNGVSEHAYNLAVAAYAAEALRVGGVDAAVWDLYPRRGYGEAMTWLARALGRWGADGALELHFNAAADGSANGREYLHWPRSSGGIALGRALVASQGAGFPGSRRRHREGLVSRGAGDGAAFLGRTPCPASIAEPFFGSNEAEVAEYMCGDGPRRLGECYADGILAWGRGRGLI